MSLPGEVFVSLRPKISSKFPNILSNGINSPKGTSLVLSYVLSASPRNPVSYTHLRAHETDS